MGTVYAIANQKGGVGKTTTAVNLAACVAEAGYETLLIDIDPQSNATLGLGIDKNLRPTVYDALLEGVPLADTVVTTEIPHLGVVPAGPDLAGATVELPRMPGSETRLAESLAADPGPVRLHPARLPAVAGTVDGQRPCRRRSSDRSRPGGVLLRSRDWPAFWTHCRSFSASSNPRLTVAGMLLTMSDNRTRLAQDVESEVRSHFPNLVFNTVIPRNVRVGEAPSFGKPVIHYDPHCAGADAYFEFAKEVAARG